MSDYINNLNNEIATYITKEIEAGIKGYLESLGKDPDQLEKYIKEVQETNTSIAIKYGKLKDKVDGLVEALEAVNDHAPAMYKYNNVEMGMIRIVRRALADYKGEYYRE